MRSIAVLQGPFLPPPPSAAASATVVGGEVHTSSPLTAPEYLASASPGDDTTGFSVTLTLPALVLFFAAPSPLAEAIAAKSSTSASQRTDGLVLAVAGALQRRTGNSIIMLRPLGRVPDLQHRQT